ncbi:MAG: diguanylate cyclase [Treponemataceae bacterium]
MSDVEDVQENADSSRKKLLNRFINSPVLGALMKGAGFFIKDYASGACIPNTLWREFGYGTNEMRGDRWKHYIHPEDLFIVEDFSARLQSGALDSWEGEYRIRAKDGSYRHLRHKALVLERTETGIPTLYVGRDVDITDQVERFEKADAERERHERRFLQSETIRTAGAILSSELDPVRAAERVLAQATRVLPFEAAAVWTLDGDQLVRLASRGFPITEAGRRETVSNDDLQSLLKMRSPRLTENSIEAFPVKLEIPLLVRGQVHGLLEFRSQGDTSFGPEEIGSAVQFADHAIVALSNALRYRATEIEAATDWLTGLPTRRSFMSRAERLKDDITKTAPVSALMVDIDWFKQVNDSFGHAVGDVSLTLVASTCRDSLRTHDLCCRYGGEEIVALLPNADGSTAYAVAERLRKKVETLRVREHPDLLLTVSVGVHTGLGTDDFRDLIARADEGLYMAKSAGRNRCEVR